MFRYLYTLYADTSHFIGHNATSSNALNPSACFFSGLNAGIWVPMATDTEETSRFLTHTHKKNVSSKGIWVQGWNYSLIAFLHAKSEEASYKSELLKDTLYK